MRRHTDFRPACSGHKGCAPSGPQNGHKVAIPMQNEQQTATAIPTQSRDSTLRWIPELDGVRGIAVLLVMLCHSLVISPLPQAARQLHLRGLLVLGWSGVDLFFVLSGFLISGILLDTKDSKNYFSSFYARRVLRIFPLYLFSVFAYFHLALPIAHHFGGWQFMSNSLEPWFWFHLSSWKIAFGEPAHWLTHFWSLSIEEQFYLFWPIVVLFAGRRWLPYVCLILITASFGLRCMYGDNDFGDSFLYTLPPFRIEPLVFGSLAAVLVRSGRMYSTLRSARFLIGVTTCGALMLFAVLLTGRTTGFAHPPMATYGFTSFAIIFSGLVLYAYSYTGSPAWLASLLRNPRLRAFGKYSYAIYVFHLPIFLVYGMAVPRVLVVLPASLRFVVWLLALVVGIGLAYVTAFVSWHLLEKHFWGLKRRFPVEY
jgi:peptidoglycan/LPS O-acetylase OafA/YrhL